MTETEWQTSTSPSALFAHLEAAGLATEGRCLKFVEACRSLGFCKLDKQNRYCNDPRHYISCVRDPLNRHHEPNVASFIRCIWGSPWRQYVVFAHAPELHPFRVNPDWLTHANGNVPKLARACVTPPCECCDGRGWYMRRSLIDDDGRGNICFRNYQHKCEECKSTGTIPVTGPLDPLRLAVLADALEEAGCCDEGILGHLRGTNGGRCELCKGQKHVTYFKGPGATNPNWKDCPECSGSGARPVVHVAGCWAVELLLHPAHGATVE